MRRGLTESETRRALNLSNENQEVLGELCSEEKSVDAAGIRKNVHNELLARAPPSANDQSVHSRCGKAKVIRRIHDLGRRLPS